MFNDVSNAMYINIKSMLKYRLGFLSTDHINLKQNQFSPVNHCILKAGMG